MTKQLLIMRHAKSSWGNAQLTDFDRPLNQRGLRATPQMAEFIHEKGLIPDLLVSSAAVRARMTAKLFVENCRGLEENQLRLTQDFYHAPASTYLNYLGSFSDPTVEVLMFVGHNPGLEDLVEQLSSSWASMPTAAIAHFELAIDHWSDDISQSSANLINLWRPKEIDLA